MLTQIMLTQAQLRMRDCLFSVRCDYFCLQLRRTDGHRVWWHCAGFAMALVDDDGGVISHLARSINRCLPLVTNFHDLKLISKILFFFS